jgi:hypothetical protein
MSRKKNKTCNKTLVMGDDFGDNSITFMCQLPAGHEGSHYEEGDMGYDQIHLPYKVSWEGTNEIPSPDKDGLELGVLDEL